MEFRSPASQEVYDYSKMKEDSLEYIIAEEDTSICRNPCSTWRSVSLIIMMVCFIAATPLSLILTLPAYILADKVSEKVLSWFTTCMYVHSFHKIILSAKVLVDLADRKI